MEIELNPEQQADINDGKCPDCGDTLRITARGGPALNLECQACHARFWAAPLFPAKRLSERRHHEPDPRD